MPFNEKNQWIDPPENHFPVSDQERGYSICPCNQAVHIHQAGFDSEMHICAMCKSEVADISDFLSHEEIEKLKPQYKINMDDIAPDNFKLT